MVFVVRFRDEPYPERQPAYAWTARLLSALKRHRLWLLFLLPLYWITTHMGTHGQEVVTYQGAPESRYVSKRLMTNSKPHLFGVTEKHPIGRPHDDEQGYDYDNDIEEEGHHNLPPMIETGHIRGPIPKATADIEVFQGSENLVWDPKYKVDSDHNQAGPPVKYTTETGVVRDAGKDTKPDETDSVFVENRLSLSKSDSTLASSSVGVVSRSNTTQGIHSQSGVATLYSNAARDDSAEHSGGSTWETDNMEAPAEDTTPYAEQITEVETTNFSHTHNGKPSEDIEMQSNEAISNSEYFAHEQFQVPNIEEKDGGAKSIVYHMETQKKLTKDGQVLNLDKSPNEIYRFDKDSPLRQNVNSTTSSRSAQRKEDGVESTKKKKVPTATLR